MARLFFVFIVLCMVGLPGSALTVPKREFRAVWVATVNNIDWPSKLGLTAEQQKKEALAILDQQSQNGMNAIIMQVRPSSDAFYKSDLEPWSRYLTGTSGKAPSPYYDPMEFWIGECHRRNMEFHAWLNPFRVAQNANEPLAANHIAFKHPEWIVNYGGKLYFDPGIPGARAFVVKVVNDIVARYDVDAIHFDDYFYPYPLIEDFPDSVSFVAYNRGFLPAQKADWRRDNVDIIIRELSENIKKTKRWVKFGISPFGVWRNKTDDPEGSDSKAGTTNYDHLYADILKWQKNGWIDYCLPQLYWQIGHPTVDFLMLAKWWADHAYNRSMYIGHAVYKLEGNSATAEWRDPQELVRQVQEVRKIKSLDGSAWYSANHFNRDLMGFDQSLREKLYDKPALVPTMPWIDAKAPAEPQHFRRKGNKLKWKTGKVVSEMDRPVAFVVYLNEVGAKFDASNPENIFTITRSNSIRFKPNSRKLQKKYEIRVSALDRLHNESNATKAKQINL